MQERSIKKALLLSLILMGCSAQVEVKEEYSPPNIVIILVDDLGKEWISCYGAEDIHTPHIDQLATSGMRFNHCYGMPQCTPSRLTLLTGQYPFRHGWVNHWDVPRWGGGAHFDEVLNPSLPAEMQKAGYKTCIAGKWQIDDFRVEPDALTRSGFDAYCMWTGYETGNPLPSGNRYFSPYIFTEAGSEIYEHQFGPDIFKDFIIDFIRKNKESPMFIYYPMVLTHTPFTDTPIDSASTQLGKHKAMVRYTDLITGELMRTLEEESIRENTLVIWTTDNGTTGSITGTLRGRAVKGGKSQTSEAGICLPFIASWPSVIESNTTSDALIDFSDLFPTCLDLAGNAVAKTYQIDERKHLIDGISFRPVLTGQSSSQRNWILGMGGRNEARLTENGVENKFVFRDRVIRNERFKLCLDTTAQAAAFYDLQMDISETNNLIDSLNSDLRKENFNQLIQVVKIFPSRDEDPKYRPNPPQNWDVDISAKSQLWKN